MTDSKIPHEKSFASHEKAKYWSNNNELKPSEISKGSAKHFYFNCDKCNHEFLMQLNVVTRGGWCNYCSNTKLCDDNNCKICFDKSFASYEKSKYWSSKNDVTPRQVFKVTAKKYLFKCNTCNHEFINNPSHVSNGRWCPYCCVPQKQLCGSKECSDCYNKSFASHEKSVYWSDKNELKPEFVMKNGDKKIWFNCDKCNHDFEAQIKRVSKDGWCPYCNSHKLCENNDCVTCLNRSFSSHEKSKHWSSKNNILPRQIVKGSGEKYWFDCDKCNHDFEKDIHAITGEKDGWCPYCVNKKMCNKDDCVNCYNKSFASHEKVKYWSNKNTENPRYLFQGDSNKYWFNCNKCEIDFESVLYNVKTGYWCPFCNNKTEGKLYKIMKEIYPSIMYQLRIDWCKNVTYLPFDFCIPEYKIIIELDGPQHFRQIMDWKTPEDQQKTDKYKEKCANENGYSIIRLLQEDVFNDKYNWKTELVNNIEKIKIDNIIQNIYMCKNNEYDDFMN
jgi:very-short-patch-repair endonuclease